MYAQMPLYRLHDLIASTTTQHARTRGADLHEELAYGRPVVHGVEGRDFVDAHRRHFEDFGDFVHDGDGGEAVLALAEVEEGHDGCFLVLGWVAFEDFGDDLLVGGVEGEGEAGVVVSGVAVLEKRMLVRFEEVVGYGTYD